MQERADIGKAKAAGNPFQIGIVGRKDVGLLIVQILNAMLDMAQKGIRLCQCICRGLRHELGLHQPQ
jgi:hypothetical protein